MKQISRRELMFAAGAAASPIALAQQRPPNVVLILADDLGYGDLSSFGAKDIQTPNIDSIAARGVRFDRFYANSPVCSPTRAALMSGRYPDRAGVPGVIRTHPENSWGRLSPDATILPATLKAANYHSALIGKWHLGLKSPDLPNQRGFDHFHGFLGDMMDNYNTHRRHDINYMRLNGEEIDPRGHATELFTDWSIEYLRSRRGQPQPFFLYLAYNAPHVPIQPPQEWLDKVKRREPSLDPKRAALAALVEHMDDGVGRVLKALEANGQRENTLVIFTSDNGGQLDAGVSCGPLRGGKQNMYEGGIRVPMCAMRPGRIAPGSKSDTVGLSMDLHATVCEAAGVKTPPGVDGVPVLSGPVSDRDLFWVRREGGAQYWGRDYYAMRRGPWKLLQNTPFEPYELYNLDDDPRETRDLSKSDPKRWREMAEAISRHVQEAGRVVWQ
jgi:arylsulfatase A-like enzyme